MPLSANQIEAWSVPTNQRASTKLKTSFSKLEAELEEAKKREELLKSERDSLKAENEMLKRNQEKQQLQLESIQSQKRRVESQGNHLERKSDSMKLLVEELLSITQQYDQVNLRNCSQMPVRNVLPSCVIRFLKLMATIQMLDHPLQTIFTDRVVVSGRILHHFPQIMLKNL